MVPPPEAVGGAGDGDAPTGGQGGDAGEAPGGAGGKQSPDGEYSDEPLYGEGGVVPGRLRLVFQEIDVPGVGSATDVAFLPPGETLERSSFLMLSRDDSLHLVDMEGGEAEVRESWPFDDEGYTGEACVATNILLDSDFENTRFVYVTKCAEVETTQLLRFEFDEERGLSNRTVIFETTNPEGQTGWHRMGSLGWESEDVLWMLVGDHDDGVPNAIAQDPTNPLGALVRIEPSRDAEGAGYEIPDGNLAEMPGAPDDTHPAVFAFGFRSPWRGTRDSLGRIWVGDVGHRSAEEVNLVTEPGQNFGWNLQEGPCVSDCEGLVDPLLSYGRAEDEPYRTEEPMAGGSSQTAIWVGEIYEDPTVDRYEGLMDGVVPFGDLFLGFVRGVSADEGGEVSMDAPIGLLHNVTSWKVGPDGYAYAVDLYGSLHVALLDYQDE